MSHLGRFIRSVRLSRKLTPQQFAVLLGYKNIDKGARRIMNLEQKGNSEPALLGKVVEALDLSPEAVEFAQELDERAQRERDNVPRRTYLVVRYSAGIYRHESLPDEITTQIEAEKYACELARKLKRQVCLGWRGRQCSWINMSGEVYARTEK